MRVYFGDKSIGEAKGRKETLETFILHYQD